MKYNLLAIFLFFLFLGASLQVSGTWQDAGSDIGFVHASYANTQNGTYATASWNDGDGDDGNGFFAALSTSSNLNAGLSTVTIDSVFFGIYGHCANGNGMFGGNVCTLNGNQCSGDVAIPTSNTTLEVGGDATQWFYGLPPLSDVNSASVQLVFHDLTGAETISVDYAYMRVVYHSSGGGAPASKHSVTIIIK